MYNRKLEKILNQAFVKLLIAELRISPQDSDEDSGFSLIEMIAVVLMVGILATISVSSWLGFMNRQQLNKANDVIFSAIQSAQQQAKRRKFSYSVSFVSDTTGTPQYAVYSRIGSATTSWSTATWKTLLSQLNTSSNNITIYSNIGSENTISSTSSSPTVISKTSVPPSNLPSQTITFDYTGALNWQVNTNDAATNTNDATITNNNNSSITVQQQNDLGSKGLIVSVKANGDTRCVIVKTLLGTLVKGKDSDCT